MNKPRKLLNVNECKIQASLLLKNLHSTQPGIAQKAIKRFQRLPVFKSLSAQEILSKSVQRKHALAVIAMENGFKSWTDLKTQIPFIAGGYLNKWFAKYDEAKAHLQISGGYLLPYKNQFFICEASYISQIGLDPDDPDWKLIGYDWAKPDNEKAWQRLNKKWIKIQESRHE